MTSRQAPWTRTLVEGIVIVGSILLAFAIDASWERRTERQDVFQALRAVEAELAENHAYFDAAEKVYQRAADGGFELLRLTGPSPSFDDTERVRFLIGELWLRAGVDSPGTGAVSTLITSGNLARIESGDLRQALALWPNFIDGLHELMGVIGNEDLFHRRMLLFVTELDFDLVNGMASVPEVRDEFVERAPSASRFPSDYIGLLADRQFESGVTARTTQALLGAELARRARTRIEELLALIEYEVG